MKRGKRYQEAEKLVDRKKLYSAKEALETIEKMPKTNKSYCDIKSLFLLYYKIIARYFAK